MGELRSLEKGVLAIYRIGSSFCARGCPYIPLYKSIFWTVTPVIHLRLTSFWTCTVQILDLT